MMKICMNKIFKQFLLSYLLAWMIPIAIGSIAYYKAYDTVKQNAVDNTVSMLEQSSMMIDSRLSELQNMVDQIMISRNLNTLLNQDNHLYQYETLRSDLMNYRITNDFIESIYICFKDKNAVVSTDAITDKTDKFFEYYLKRMGLADNGTYHDFLKRNFSGEFFIAPAQRDNAANDEGKVISYITSFPRGSKSPQGAIIVNIQEKELKKLLGAALQKNEWLYIVDAQGRVISSVGNHFVRSMLPENFIHADGQKAIKLAGDGMVLSYAASHKNDWEYVAGFTTRTIMAKVEAVRNFTVGVAAVMLLSGLLIAVFMANRTSRPINRLVETLKENNNDYGGKNPFELLHGSISQLLESNETLKNEMKEKVPLLKAAFLDRLLRGGFNSMTELRVAMHSTGIEMNAGKYIVALIRIDLDGNSSGSSDQLLNELHMAKRITSKVIGRISSEKVLLHEVGKNVLAAVFAFSFDDDTRIRNAINHIAAEVHQYLKERNNIHVYFAAGLPCHTPFDIYRSFDEALQASGYKTLDKDDYIIWYVKPSYGNSYYYYPVEMENKIINLVKVGDEEGISTLFDDLYKENRVNRQVDKEMAHHLMVEMKGTLLRLIPLVNFEDEEFVKHIREMVDSIDRINRVEDVWEHVRGLYSQICSEVNQNKSQYSSQLKNRIMEFIHVHYKDQQLNRYRIASEFGLSEGYLSRFFKEQTGESVSKYLEQVRMEKAKELIEETKLPIINISERVGYSSAHTFRRVYKKFYGMLPSEVR